MAAPVVVVSRCHRESRCELEQSTLQATGIIPGRMNPQQAFVCARANGTPFGGGAPDRGHTIGFVFQYYRLVMAFTTPDNVMMPTQWHRARA
jgi:ABC-type uncharacterized transport system ATPase subunit